MDPELLNSGLAESTVREFVSCINSHDTQEIIALCSQDHVFIDSLGVHRSGLAEIKKGWEGYFELFPDYRIEIDTFVSKENVVLMSGWASGSLRGSVSSWRIPAAWRAKVAGEQIVLWQVFADNKPVYELLHDA